VYPGEFVPYPFSGQTRDIRVSEQRMIKMLKLKEACIIFSILAMILGAMPGRTIPSLHSNPVIEKK
jgi:hypothetical protein